MGISSLKIEFGHMWSEKKQNTFPDTYTSIAKPIPSVVFPGFINRWRELNNRQKLLPLPCAWLEEILWSNSYYDGSLPWLRCACSARSEKPKEAKRCPLWTPGTKTCQHCIAAGVFPCTGISSRAGNFQRHFPQFESTQTLSPDSFLQIDLTKFGNQSDNIRFLIAGERYNEWL